MSDLEEPVEYKTCDRCYDKPAAVNIQKLWLRWKYDPSADDYSQEFEIMDVPPDDDLHLCIACEEEIFGEHRESNNKYTLRPREKRAVDIDPFFS